MGNEKGSACTPFLGSLIPYNQIIPIITEDTKSCILLYFLSLLQAGACGTHGCRAGSLWQSGQAEVPCTGRLVSVHSGEPMPCFLVSLFAVVLGGRLTVAQTPPSHLAGRTKRHAGHSHLGSLADKGQLVRTNGQVDLPPSLPTSDTEM